MSTARGHKNSFTLIELLVVVGLSALILGLGIPAFNRMMRGNQVGECAGNIKLGLEQAQLRAASERRYVAVIFPNGSGTDVDQYRLGGFRCAYVKKNTSGDGGYTFDKWVDGTWKNAPSGAVLANIAAEKYTPDSNGNVSGCTTKTDNPVSGASNLKTLADLKDDQGAALNAGTNTAIVFTPYGGTVGSTKLYLLVSEAAVNGGDISYPSTGKSGETANYLVLKVNNLTGRVEYGNE